MKRLGLFLFVAGLLSILPIWAMTGEELLTRCNQLTNELQNMEQPASHNSWWCMGYIKGYADGHAYSSIVVGRSFGKKDVTNADGILYCPPAQVTYDQLATVVINYLKQNPDQLRVDTEVLVGHALANAYPCPRR